jgi:hypothetical protein
MTAASSSSGDSDIETPTVPRSRYRATMGPFWTLAFWVTVVVLCIGGYMLATPNYIPGGILVGASLISFIVLLRHWLTHRKAVVSGFSDVTINAQTYRMASARTSKEFMAGLAKIEGELHRIGNEESWDIDWPTHATTIAAAREALDRKQTRRAMSEMGKAIDVLVVGLHAHRKRLRSTHISSQSGSTEALRGKDDSPA